MSDNNENLDALTINEKIAIMESDITEIKNILQEIRGGCCCKNVDNTLLSMNRILAEIDNTYNLAKVQKTLTDLASKMPNEEPSSNIKPNGEQKKVVIKTIATYYKDNWIDNNIEVDFNNKKCAFRNVFTPKNWKEITEQNKNVLNAKSGKDKLNYMCELAWRGLNINIEKFKSKDYTEAEQEVVVTANERYNMLLDLYNDYKESQ